MPHSCIRLEKLFKQGRQYNNLKSINLGRLFNQFLEIFMDPSFYDSDRGYDLDYDRDCGLVETMETTCFVVSTNGFSIKDEAWVDSISGEHLLLRPVYLGGWNESNPSEQNHVTITVKIKYWGMSSSSDDPKITWLGVHVDCICCGSSSVPDDIDHHSFPSDVGLQMDTTNGLDLPMGHPSLGFTYGLDDQDSSTIARICDNTEPPPLPAIFSTPYGSDLDHGSNQTRCQVAVAVEVIGLKCLQEFKTSEEDDTRFSFESEDERNVEHSLKD
ncbi:hypothetical protein CMV_022789 [Castanea mollissima]|uniref:Uncharacterized protein n=1 Tax=Castanea mollissima TaxID=60419 RepID=A0A8J4QQN5_9ROSI|nr:hypothetical protein CMV_022789 [Castanea mollissima]